MRKVLHIDFAAMTDAQLNESFYKKAHTSNPATKKAFAKLSREVRVDTYKFLLTKYSIPFVEWHVGSSFSKQNQQADGKS